MSIKFLNGIDVDNGVLYTDTSNNRVGINTSSPQVPLEVKYTGSVDEIIRIVGTASGKPQLNFYNDTTLHTKIVAAGNNDFSISNTHSTGDMFFATGGATRLHIESSGLVGIGTNTPGYKLDVNGSIRSGGNYLGSGSAYTYLSIANGNYHHKFYTRTNTAAASERFTIEGGAGTTDAYFSNVNVGIGTTSPGAKLDVEGRVDFSNDLRLRGTDSSANQGVTRFYVDSSNKLLIDTANNGSNIFVIDSAGNVGIGNTSPTKELEIGTNAAAETELRMHSDVSGKYFNIQSAGNFTSVKTTGSQNFILDSSGSSGYVTVVTNASERMRVNYNGNVGIGTTSPSEKLGVFGNIRLENGAQRNIIGPTNENLGIFANPNGADEGILFSTDNGTTTEMIILNGGNVGIGKTNPSVKLHIGPGTAPSSTTEEFRIQTGVSGGYGGTAVINLLTGQYGNSGIYFGDQATYSNQPAFIEFQDSPSTLIYKAPATSGSHVFKIGTSEQVKIAYNGYVGIGMSNPGAKLHVGVSTGSSSTTQEFLLQTQSGGYGGEAIVNLRTGQYGTSGIYFGDGLSHTSQPAYLKFIDSSNSLGLKTTGSFSLTVNSSVEMYVSATGLGVGTTSPGEKLEVNGTVKATATTDAYKGYIKNTINTIVHEKSASADFNYVPFNTVSTGNSNQYYNAFVAPYNGRVKKIHVRHSGGSTPTATAVRFKKQVNGTLSSTQYQATVSNGATTNMQAEYNFSNSDFTFNEGDLLRIAMQTSDAFGTGSRTMGGGAVAIVLEYNIT